jgi:2-haloacid dehalogenase
LTVLDFEPKYITFDCYGTLVNFQMSATTVPLVTDRIDAEDMETFLADFRAYRLDEVLGEYKPYPQVLTDSFRRTCQRWGIGYRPDDARAIVDAVPTWGPHPGVPEALTRLASRYPLVILSNAADDQLGDNVQKLGAPFHAVYTAEQARAYKPRLQAFEYMLDRLGCTPQDILHVSSHVRYDLMPAWDLRITHKVYLDRGFDPSVPFYDYHEISDIADLPALLGL